MATAKEKKLSFHGKGETLFGIHITNLFFTIITLGIYYFWANVKTRKYLWGQLEFEEDRFSYHGTPQEILRGWFKALLVFGIPYVVLRYGPHLAGASIALIGIGTLLSLVLILVFIPFATVGSRRYRLSRTAWRGIRFSFQESWKSYAPIFFKGHALSLITLSLYAPYYDAKREKFLISNSYIGNRNFDYDGNGDDLFGSHFLSLVLAGPTLFFSLIWYSVKRNRYVWNHTTFGDGRFVCTITFGGQLKIYVLNALQTIFTLGFGLPWAQVRSIRYLLDNLSLNGSPALNSIKQDTQVVNATGEELSTFLNLDFDLG
jgi:uncharacterized membrane protein YjgN (DUF898 family)